MVAFIDKVKIKPFKVATVTLFLIFLFHYFLTPDTICLHILHVIIWWVIVISFDIITRKKNKVHFFIAFTYFAAGFTSALLCKKKSYCRTDQVKMANHTKDATAHCLKWSVCSKGKGFYIDKFEAVITPGTPIMRKECMEMQSIHEQHQNSTKKSSLTSNSNCGKRFSTNECFVYWDEMKINQMADVFARQRPLRTH